MKNKLINIVRTAVGVMLFSSVASAATTIHIKSVEQRWPWNNKVDITYTVTGGQDLAGGNFQKIVFTTVIDGTTYTIDGVTDVGASANAGTHTVTWTLPDGVRSTNCTMSAAIYASDVPSGDDYMIVDLTKTSDNVSWEGLLATQEASNERYNTAEFKTDRLVLRKVPAGGPYPTGDSANYAQYNPATNWVTDRAYYVGVFPVTQRQYQNICGENPSYYKTEIEGNEVPHRPVERVSWIMLRNPSGYEGVYPSTSALPPVTSNSGTFFQKLNYITGNRYGFDLPTEVMSEIAARAGATTVYYWGNTMDKAYVVCNENSGGITVAVGSRLPNAWGLYDVAGNIREWCLDDVVTRSLPRRADPFTPAWATSSARRYRGSGTYATAETSEMFHASWSGGIGSDASYYSFGFRVYMIAD